MSRLSPFAGVFLAVSCVALGCTTEPSSEEASPTSAELGGGESIRAIDTPARVTPAPRDVSHPVTTPGVKELTPVPTPVKEEVKTMPPADISPGLRGLVEGAVADLAERLKIDEGTVEVVEVRTMVWPDGSLGCPEPGVAYTQVQREGLLIRLRAQHRVYQYHGGGGRPPFLCEHPAVPEDLPPSPGLGVD